MDFEKLIVNSIRVFDCIFWIFDLDSVLFIKKGNVVNYVVGLGVMNLYGFLVINYIYYDF